MSIISNDVVMSLLVDFILLIVIVLTVISSMRKGFFKTVLSLVCVVVALVLASALCGPVAEFCYDNLIRSVVVNGIEDKINSATDGINGVNAIKSVVDSLPSIVTDKAAALGVNLDGIINDISWMNLSAEETAEHIAENIVRPGALVILKVVSYLLLYLFIRFICNIVAGGINRLMNVSIFKKANRLMGAVIGLIRGVAIVIVLASLLNLYANIIDNSSFLYRAIEFSSICGIIKDVNFLGFLQINPV